MKMIAKAFLFSVVSLFVTACAQDCNICGDGNSIQYPQGVVEFMYQGAKRKNSCQTWQKIVTNPVAISDEFCRKEMLAYTVETCICTTPEGVLVSTLYGPPTQSPGSDETTSDIAKEENSDSAQKQKCFGSVFWMSGLVLFVALF